MQESGEQNLGSKSPEKKEEKLKLAEEELKRIVEKLKSHRYQNAVDYLHSNSVNIAEDLEDFINSKLKTVYDNGGEVSISYQEDSGQIIITQTTFRGKEIKIFDENPLTYKKPGPKAK